jgi:hypothetical protein
VRKESLRRGSVRKESVRKGNVRKGSVIDDQFGMCVALFLLNCWIAGCQVLLSSRLSSRLKLCWGED